MLVGLTREIEDQIVAVAQTATGIGSVYRCLTDELPRKYPCLVIELQGASHEFGGVSQMRSTMTWALWIGLPAEQRTLSSAWQRLLDAVDSLVQAFQDNPRLGGRALVSRVTSAQYRVEVRDPQAGGSYVEARLELQVTATR